MEKAFDPKFAYPRHSKAHNSGGIHLTEQAGKVQEVVVSLVKNMGAKVKEGGMTDLLKLSRPAIISYHKTYLECVSGDFFNTQFLNKAAETTDPIDRMKWVITFFISGIHRNPFTFQNNGPLNPVVGETYTAEKADGTTLYCEQISHHPPVSAYLIVGPNKSYKCYGTGELDVKMNGFNNIIGKRIGKTTVEFANGGKVVFTNPDTRIDGILMGDRRYNYIKTCVFLDKGNKLSAELTFLYEESSTISKVTSGLKKWFVATKEKPPSDLFEIVFFKYDKQQGGDAKKEVLKEGSGSWVSYVQVGEQVLWRVDEEVDQVWIEDPKKQLPSDSSLREDSKFIKIKDFENAQKEKDSLENRQRADAKLRKEYKEKQEKEKAEKK